MLTRMSEADWAVALDVFRAACSRRGDRGRGDRRSLEALRYLTLHNVAWLARPPGPAEFGRWDSIGKRFRRLGRSGVFGAFFQALAGLSRTARPVQMFDSTAVRAHVSAAGATGGRMVRRSARPLARRLLGQDPPQDRLRRPAARLPPRRRRGRRRPPVRDAARHRARHRAARGGGRQRVRRQGQPRDGAGAGHPPGHPIPCRRQGPVRILAEGALPRHSCRRRSTAPFLPKALYRAILAEGALPRPSADGQTTGKLERFERIALRCEKTAENYAALVASACGLSLRPQLGQIRPHGLGGQARRAGHDAWKSSSSQS
jgi:hypothetical protein